MVEAQEVITHVHVRDRTANPSPLGFTGLGLSAVLLSLSYIGLYPVDSMIVSMAIFLGGFAQVFAGIMAWKKGSVFGGTAFCAFGLFWFSLAGLILMPSLGWIEGPEPLSLAAYLFLWGVYTFVMLIATLKLGSKAIMFVFVTLFLLFMLLAVVNATGNTGLLVIAGYVGLILGLSALYTGLAEVLNDAYGRTVVPI
ncbi:GPR1/FUN34/yaaH family protein [Methanosarcina horonobensis HB-1 = JCM 15518]|uniref:GPR1/FUN34/yaaH family protein n=1 Tax=Methanosarcina horonobensis HB-1 = JCM 15518 TaxID=1434110 RepID=A0A0E3SEB8_9EURY|nr:GPR1/FUN34/YaaH family transporter [Methanosarcina horonobensis]AKB80504.1 GPR1/FUN34/yaaH family protein [Methanosarcina horonobensis HB-1 = JCM 15518]